MLFFCVCFFLLYLFLLLLFQLKLYIWSVAAMPFSKPQLESNTTMCDLKPTLQCLSTPMKKNSNGIFSLLSMIICGCLLSIYSFHFYVRLFDLTWIFHFFNHFLRKFQYIRFQFNSNISLWSTLFVWEKGFQQKNTIFKSLIHGRGITFGSIQGVFNSYSKAAEL